MGSTWLRKFFAGLMAVVFATGFAFPAAAEVTLDDLLKRIEALEQENATLKGEVTSMKDKQNAQEMKISAVQAAPAAAPLAPTGNFLKTKLDVELYGFVMAQGSYSTSDMDGSNAPSSAPKETAISNPDQDEFNLTGQDTRLGLNIKGPDLEDGAKTSAKFEMDFAANNGPTYQPRLRLAYVQLDYDKWGINAGQNWDFIAPINANIVNPGSLYGQGNLGTRHPQMHIANKWGEVLGGKLMTKVGVIDVDDTDDSGTDSGVPVLGAFTSYETKIAGVASTFNIGGLWGEVENSRATDHSLWAVVAGMTLKLTDWLAFKAEAFSGAKLDDLKGGSSLGMTSYLASGSDKKPLRVKGGFAELTYNPVKKIEMNFGAGIDMVNDDAFINPVKDPLVTTPDAANVYEYNATTYANLKYNLSKELQVALEYQYFQTEWVNGTEGDANRVMSAIIYKF